MRDIFTKVNDFDFNGLQEEKQERYINQMAYNIDGRIIDFFDNNRNFATTLKKLSEPKNPFPQINLEKSNQLSLVLLQAYETLPGTSD